MDDAFQKGGVGSQVDCVFLAKLYSEGIIQSPMIADQANLSNGELRTLLHTYRARYSLEYDEMLRNLERKHCFNRKELNIVATWKFNSWRQRLTRTQNLLERNSDRDIEHLSLRAFRCNDDLGALLLIELLDGVGKALGSAILMAHDPGALQRYRRERRPCYPSSRLSARLPEADRSRP